MEINQQYDGHLTQKQYDYLVVREGYANQKNVIDFAQKWHLNFADTRLLCDWHKYGLYAGENNFWFEDTILMSIFSQVRYPFILEKYHAAFKEVECDIISGFYNLLQYIKIGNFTRKLNCIVTVKSGTIHPSMSAHCFELNIEPFDSLQLDFYAHSKEVVSCLEQHGLPPCLFTVKFVAFHNQSSYTMRFNYQEDEKYRSGYYDKLIIPFETIPFSFTPVYFDKIKKLPFYDAITSGKEKKLVKREIFLPKEESVFHCYMQQKETGFYIFLLLNKYMNNEPVRDISLFEGPGIKIYYVPSLEEQNARLIKHIPIPFDVYLNLDAYDDLVASVTTSMSTQFKVINDTVYISFRTYDKQDLVSVWKLNNGSLQYGETARLLNDITVAKTELKTAFDNALKKNEEKRRWRQEQEEKKALKRQEEEQRKRDEELKRSEENLQKKYKEQKFKQKKQRIRQIQKILCILTVAGSLMFILYCKR